MTKTPTHLLLASLLSLEACGPPVDTGGASGSGGSAPTGGGGAGGTGGEACACDCEPTAPSTHPLAYCEDPAHDALPCCRDDGEIGECSGGGCVAFGDGGAAPATCSDPLLGYDAASTPTGPLIPNDADLAGIVAAVLLPFPAPTTCETVIVGLAIGPAPCELPSAIDVVTFDATAPLPEGTATVTTLPISGPLIPTEDPLVFEARLPLHTEHPADRSPFVGAVVRANFCPALLPSCGPERAMRFRASPPSKGWHQLSQDLPDEPGTDGALYFGLADCAGQ